MLDDFDRDTCAHIETLIVNALQGEGMKCEQVKFNDPGMEIEVHTSTPHSPTLRPNVRITIEWQPRR